MRKNGFAVFLFLASVMWMSPFCFVFPSAVFGLFFAIYFLFSEKAVLGRGNALVSVFFIILNAWRILSSGCKKIPGGSRIFEDKIPKNWLFGHIKNNLLKIME